MKKSKYFIVAFISNFCMMAIEIIAGRILAPYIGVSHYTWTTVIGIVLIGISIGGYLGGKLSDSIPYPNTLGWVLLLGGISVLSIPPMVNICAPYTINNLPYIPRIVLITTIIFFVPSMVLGMITPIVLKLSIINLDNVGNIAGKIYAIGTVGAILGTFVAGFFLIPLLGTRLIFILVGLILIIASFLFGSLLMPRHPKHPTISSIVIIMILVGSLYAAFPLNPIKSEVFSNSIYYKESNYYTIRVVKPQNQNSASNYLLLYLDLLLHSYVNINDPLDLRYEYIKMYGEIIDYLAMNKPVFSSLNIGGGGYVFPKYMEAVYPGSSFDVVEIDPEVTNVDYEYLGLSRSTKIKSYNLDGRWYLMNCRKKYDFIFMDAINDISIPYNLVTMEFNELIKQNLDDDGFFITYIIDRFPGGDFIYPYYLTLCRVFGDGNVSMFVPINNGDIVYVASRKKLDINKLTAFLANKYKGKHFTTYVSPEFINRKLNKKYAFALSDDYVPVEHIRSSLFMHVKK